MSSKKKDGKKEVNVSIQLVSGLFFKRRQISFRQSKKQQNS